MNPMPNFSWPALLALIVVLGCAGSTRTWYILRCTDNGQRAPALAVQGPYPHSGVAEGAALRARSSPTQLDNLVANLADHLAFECRTPLCDKEERTSHLAPGYPWLFGIVAHYFADAERIMRWLQCVLGSLTAGCYFFFARRAFHSTLVALLTGLLVAFYPFWIINTAELNYGVLASFLMGVSLMLGARGSQNGGAFTSLFLGLALAGVAMVRAAFLPFAMISLLWYLWRCRKLPLGWFAGFLALLGFANGIAPWALRNYQLFDRPVPIATSTYLHLWMGNNPKSTGVPLEEAELRASLSAERLQEMLNETNQAKRYNLLATEVIQEIQDHPTATVSRRLQAALVFWLGERWFSQRQVGLMQENSERIVSPPDWLKENAEMILQGTLLGMFVLALLGWRWSHAWRRYGRIATIAVVWIPLPYVLSHAESLSGPRLPIDGILLCYAAFALASFIPGVARSPDSKSSARPNE